MASSYDDIVSSATQTSTPRTLFRSTADGGSDTDNAVAISVLNTGTKDALVWCKGHHGDDPGSENFGRLPAGLSVTFEVESASDTQIKLSKIVAKTVGGDTTTLSWMVTKRR